MTDQDVRRPIPEHRADLQGTRSREMSTVAALSLYVVVGCRLSAFVDVIVTQRRKNESVISVGRMREDQYYAACAAQVTANQ
jgi:hypothetical protein